jgi:CheY-like chemotaxis protein
MRKLLIIDDDAEVALLLKAKFEKAGDFQVVLATDGEAAVELARTEGPDIIICDVDMPDMDGPAVAAELAKNDATKQIPLLFLSSLVTPTDVARGVKAGGKQMLSKQSPVADLIRAIDDTLFKAKR